MKVPVYLFEAVYDLTASPGWKGPFRLRDQIERAARHGRGFSVRNVWQMKAFYLAWPILQTVSAESKGFKILQTSSAESCLSPIASRFPLPYPDRLRVAVFGCQCSRCPDWKR